MKLSLLTLEEVNHLQKGEMVIVSEPQSNWEGLCRVEVKEYRKNKKMTSLVPMNNKLSKSHGYSFWEYTEDDISWIQISKE